MKTYTGKRTNNNNEVWVLDSQGGHLLDSTLSLRILNHWGYQDSGPAQLSLAILLDHTGDADTAQAYYQMFKVEHVSHWKDTWKITGEEIDAWLLAMDTKYKPMTTAEHNAFPDGRYSGFIGQ